MHTGGFQKFHPLRQIAQKHRRRRGIEYFPGMGIKSQRHRHCIQLLSNGNNFVEQLPVPQMHSVKNSDRQRQRLAAPGGGSRQSHTRPAGKKFSTVQL